MEDVPRQEVDAALDALGTAWWFVDLGSGTTQGSTNFAAFLGLAAPLGSAAAEHSAASVRGARPWPNGEWRTHESTHRITGGSLLCRMAAIRDDHGSIVGVFGLEVPQRPDYFSGADDAGVFADAQLLNDVFAAQPALVCRWRQDGTVLWCNDAYAGSLGLEMSEVIGSNWVDRIAQIGHDTRDNLEQLRMSLVDGTAEGMSTVVSALRGDGPTRWIQWTHRRLPSTGDGPVVVQEVGVEVTELRTARDALHAMAYELALGRESERRSLARRLHDDVVQPLVSASWAISPADGQTAIPAADADRAAEMVRAAIDHLRRCLTELTSPVQPVVSVSDAISAECDAVRVAGITLTMNVAEVPNEEARGVAARVVNEALRNVVRHAHATAVTVSIDVDDGLVVGAIADNGVGTTEDDLTRALASGHVGLLTSRSLVEAVGGTFAVRRVSTSGGVMVRFTMPLPLRSVAPFRPI